LCLPLQENFRKYRHPNIMENQESEKSRILPVWQGKILLIVEDEEHNYTYIHEILNRTRIGMIRAETGKEAITLFRKNKVDAVLMDIKLPDMDGYKATREIKKLKPAIPVIAQTAYAMTHERDKCISAGCDDYISKPFTPSTLISLIAKYIS
jgi:two-component system, cell cycle response regulator DivK